MANEKRLIDANIVMHKINAFAASVVYRGSDLMFTGKDSCNPHEYTRGYEQGVLDAQKILGGQPTVDAVEVVHGRWIHPKGYVVSNAFFCSVCNHEELSFHVIHPLPGGGCKADEHGNFYYPPKMNYCPNCGANMMEGDGNGN